MKGEFSEELGLVDRLMMLCYFCVSYTRLRKPISSESWKILQKGKIFLRLYSKDYPRQNYFAAKGSRPFFVSVLKGLSYPY